VAEQQRVVRSQATKTVSYIHVVYNASQYNTHGQVPVAICRNFAKVAMSLGGKMDFSSMLDGRAGSVQQEKSASAREQFGDLADCCGFGPEVIYYD